LLFGAKSPVRLTHGFGTSRQPGDEVERFEDDVGGAVAIWRFARVCVGRLSSVLVGALTQRKRSLPSGC